MAKLWIVKARKRPTRQQEPKELEAPPPAPVPWRITRLRGKRVKVPPIFARTWFEARAVAMIEHHVERWEIEIER
jgi:hypothetical protein